MRDESPHRSIYGLEGQGQTKALAYIGRMNVDLILRHMIAAFISVDADWIIRTANPRATTLIRVPLAELEGQSLWERFPDLGGSPGETELRNIAKGAIERKFEHFSPSLYNWFEVWAVPNEGGLYIFFRDVTDRARAMQSEAVRESLRRVLMDAPIAISMTRGPDHRFELLNQASRDLVGGRNLEGMPARVALPESDPALFALLDRVYQSGEPTALTNLEITYDRLGDGVLYTGTFDVSYQPLREADGTIYGVLSISIEK